MNFFSAITIKGRSHVKKNGKKGDIVRTGRGGSTPVPKVEQRWLCIFLIWFANIDMPVSMPWVFSPSLPRMLDCPKSWQPWYATSPFSEKQKSYLGNLGNLIILRKKHYLETASSPCICSRILTRSDPPTRPTVTLGITWCRYILFFQVLYYNMYFKLLSWQAEGGC